MPRNILIDPQRTGTANPNIQFSGSMANTIRLEVLTSGSVQFTGVSGSLLSITDSLSGSLFAVSDISGLPILETFSDDRVVMGKFNSNALVVTGSLVGVGTSGPSARLFVSGTNSATTPTMIVREGVPSPTGGVGVLNVQNSAGTSLFFVSGSGNVGIGTNNPANALHVLTGGSAPIIAASTSTSSWLALRYSTTTALGYVGTGNGLVTGGASSDLALRAETGSILFSSVATERMRIDSSGNVGIGTATMGDKLSVNGTMSVTGSYLNPGVDNSTALGSATKRWSNVVATAFSGSLTRLSDGTTAYIQAGSGISVTTGSNGAITIATSGGGAVTGTGITNYVARWSSASNLTTGVLYDDGTNVGIGTTAGGTPDRLVIAAPAGTSPYGIIIGETYGAGSGRARLGLADANRGIGLSSADHTVVHTWSTNSILFGHGTPTSLTERLRIDSSGNVGIGTTAIDSKLVVNGNSVFSGSVNPDGDLTRDLGSSTKRWNNFYAANISGSLTGSNVTAGQVIVAGTGGVLSGSNNLFWDNTNRGLGIGTSTSLSYPLTVFAPAATSVIYSRSGNTNGAALFLGDSSGILGQLYMTSTGTWLDYSTTLNFRSGYGGTSRMLIDSSGNVGVGTATAGSGNGLVVYRGSGTSAYISSAGNANTPGSTDAVFGQGSNNIMYVWNRANAEALFATNNTERMRIDTAGNVGVGTINPSAKLHVNSALQIGDWSQSTTSLRFSRSVSTIQADAAYRVDASNTPLHSWIEGGFLTGERAGTITAPNSGRAYYEEWYGNSTSTYKSFGFITQTSGSNFNNTHITSSLAIRQDGNVGIGTLSFGARLFVSGSSTATTPTMIVREGVPSPTGGALAFEVENSAGTTILAVSGSGNVGIGTSTPSTRLDIVSGTLRAQYFAGAYDGEIVAGVDSGGYYYGTGFGRNTSIPILIGSNASNIIMSAGGGERMRIVGSNGNVGIGTNSPVGFGRTLQIYNSSGQSEIKLTNNTTGAAALDGSIFAQVGNSLQIYNLENDVIQLGTNNTERARIDASGNVGIGAGTNITAKLLVTGSGTGTGATAHFVNSSGTSTLLIRDNGNVGIGNTNPVLKLDFGTNNTGFFLKANPGAASSVVYTGHAHNDMLVGSYIDGGSYSNHVISFGHIADASRKLHIGSAGDASFNASTSFVPTMTFTAGNSVGVGTSSPTVPFHVYSSTIDMVLIEQSNDSTWNRIQFKKPSRRWTLGQTTGSEFVLSDETAGAYRMSVNNLGNVGIGTDGAAETGVRLVVSGGLGNIRIGQVYPAYNGITLNGSTSQNDYNLLSRTTDQTLYINRPSGNAMRFREANSDQVIISSGGNVGIGITANASYKLHVNGSFAVWDGTNGRAVLVPSNSSVTGYVEWRNGSATRLGYMGGGSSTNMNITMENGANLLIDGGTIGMGVGSGVGPSGTGNTWIEGRLIVGNTANSASIFLPYGTGGTYAGFKITHSSTNVAGAADFTDFRMRPAFSSGVSNSSDVNVIRFNNTYPHAFPDVILVPSGGYAAVGVVPSPAAQFTVSGSSTTTVATTLIKAGAPSPTGPVLDIQNSTGSSLVVVSGSGNVGVSTNNPGARLHVIGSAVAGYFLFQGGITNAGYGEFRNSSGTAISYLGNAGGGALSAGTASDFAIRAETNLLLAIGNSEKARIDASGNVGIGTNNTNGNRLAISGGNLSVTGSVLPGATTTYDLGSTTYLWRDVYARTGSFSGDVSISGNLTVLGTQTIISSSQVNIGDNIILLNAVSNPQQYGGIYVADTTANTTGSLRWNSSTDRWEAGLAGSEVALPTGSGTTGYLTRWASSSTFGNSVVYDDGTNVGINTTSMTLKLEVSGSDARIHDVRVGRGNNAGTHNTAVGNGSLNSITTGNYNTAVGRNTLNALSSGSDNVAVGWNAGASYVIGNQNISIGANAASIQVGSYNTAMGYLALYGTEVANGSHNIAIGYQSGQSHTTANNNTLLGNYAGQAITTGGNNFFGGYQAGYSQSTATNNTFVGYQAGYVVTSGSNNTMLGTSAGNIVTTGSGSVYIGFQASPAAATDSNTIVIGSGSVGRGSNTTVIGNGLTSLTLFPSGSLAMGGTATGTNAVSLGNNNTASGNYSVALGQNGTSNSSWAFSAGIANTASGNGAVAMGQLSIASGGSSVSIGYSNVSSNNAAASLGAYNTSSGDSSVTMGRFSLASAPQAIAIGSYVTGSGPSAVAIGNNSIASSTGSIAIGPYNTASSTGAAAIGGSNIASGGYGFAAGYNSTASGFGSVSMGGGANVANTAFAIAIGSTNTASGTAAAAIGTTNTASGASSAAIGQYSLATGAQAIAIGSYVTGSNTSAVAIGLSCTASGQSSVAIGASNTANALLSTALGGISNTASGIYSVAVGAYNAASGASTFISGLQGTAYLNGQRSHSVGYFAAGGDAQISTLVARNSTTNATATELFTNGSSQRIVLPASTTWDADITVVARASTGTSHASFRRRCVITRNASNTTALAGSVQVIGSDIGTNSGSPPSGWGVTISADDTNESLKIEVTGAASTNIRWVARIELVEVGY